MEFHDVVRKSESHICLRAFEIHPFGTFITMNGFLTIKVKISTLFHQKFEHRKNVNVFLSTNKRDEYKINIPTYSDVCKDKTHPAEQNDDVFQVCRSFSKFSKRHEIPSDSILV